MVPTVAIIAWKHSHGVDEHGSGRPLAWPERAASRTIPAEPGVAVRRIPGGKQKFESAMMAVSSAVEAPAAEAVPEQSAEEAHKAW